MYQCIARLCGKGISLECIDRLCCYGMIGCVGTFEIAYKASLVLNAVKNDFIANPYSARWSATLPNCWVICAESGLRV